MKTFFEDLKEYVFVVNIAETFFLNHHHQNDLIISLEMFQNRIQFLFIICQF